jgi:hypothetical protein
VAGTYALGVVLQVAGVVLAGAGLWQTWRQFGPPEGLLPARRLLAEAWSGLKDLSRRVATRLGVKRKGRTEDLRATMAGAGRMSGRVRVSFRSLPSDLPVRDALAELDDRTRRIAEQLANLQEAIADERGQAERRHEDLADQLRATRAHLEERDRLVAVGGVRLEALGLFLVGLGLTLQVTSG